MRVPSTVLGRTTLLPKAGLLTSHQKTFRGFYLVKVSRENVIWAKTFLQTEDVPCAHSVIKVAYLQCVCVPKDKEPSF